MESKLESEISQASYVETPYNDSSWEVVGDYNETQEFLPLQLEVVPGSGLVSDPMFADYGGVLGGSAAVRWHLPEDQMQRELSRAHEEAQEPAEPRVSLTEAELQAIRQEAEERGRAAAAKQAEEAQTQRFAHIEGQITKILKDIAGQLEQRLAAAEREAAQLAIEIAKKIIDEAVTINPEYIVTILQQAVRKAGGAVIHKIRVSPEDMEFIEVVGVARKIKEFDSSWKFESDESIKSGCIVETSAGEIDFELEGAWERIKAQVVKVI